MISPCFKTCFKCGNVIAANRVLRHCKIHLIKEQKLDWYFKCLICINSKQFTSVNLNSFRRHLANEHFKLLRDCTIGMHYLDRRTEFHNLLRTEARECFDYVPRRFKSTATCNEASMKKKRIILKSTYVATCGLCSTTVRNSNSMMMQHAVTHIKIETSIKNLCICLICEKDGRIYDALTKWRMNEHLRYKHRVLQPTPDVHYLDNTKMYKNELESLLKRCFPDYATL